jgi:hypothetical protein
MASTKTDQQSKRPSWREVIKIHPAAELFPPLPEDELRELGEDIKAHGMRHPVSFWVPGEHSAIATEGFGHFSLLDGRNRLDAIEAIGYDPLTPVWLHYHCIFEADGADPYEYVISANVHRRHLTTAQKRELVEKLLREKPERSNNAIAKMVKASDKTVDKIRTNLEANSEIPNKERVEVSGRKARGRKPAGHSTGSPAARACVSFIASTPLSPRINGVQQLAQKREAAITAIVAHLRRDPIVGLSDLAMIFADERAHLAKVSEFTRRDALEKIAPALGVRIAGDVMRIESPSFDARDHKKPNVRPVSTRPQCPLCGLPGARPCYASTTLCARCQRQPAASGRRYCRECIRMLEAENEAAKAERRQHGDKGHLALLRASRRRFDELNVIIRQL